MKILRKVYQSDYVRDKSGTGQPSLYQRLLNTYFKIQVTYKKIVSSIVVRDSESTLKINMRPCWTVFEIMLRLAVFYI